MRGNFFTICSGFYILLLLIVFFSKKRLNSIENTIYSYLIVTNFFGVILAIMCYFCILQSEVLGLFNTIISKSYVIYVLTWVSIFSVYVFTIIFNSRDLTVKEREKKQKNLYIITFIIYIIFALLVCIFPLYYMENIL